jgi:3-phosphoshikimate 1-carboxyvinyltransferase
LPEIYKYSVLLCKNQISPDKKIVLLSEFLLPVDIYQLYPKNLKEVRLVLPCSKSVANRMIILASYFDAPVQITNVTFNTDIKTCVDSLQQFGFSVEYYPEFKTLQIQKSHTEHKNIHLETGPSGTTLRFMTALSPFLGSEIYINGDNSLKKRPVQGLLEVLASQLGVTVTYHEKEGYLPFTLIPTADFPKTKHLTVTADKSSQFASALLMILPHLETGATLTLIPPVNSYSYIELTHQVMQEMGFEIEKTTELIYTYKGRTLPEKEITFTTEGDWSAATFWYGYTALSGKKSALIGLNPQSVQGERSIQQIMQKMGIHSEFNSKNELEIFPSNHPLQAIHTDLTLLPDATPMLAVLCAFAQGKSTLTGLQTLTYKETNRIKALVQELAKMNVYVEYTSDSLTIQGTQPQSGIIETYQDHRMAMAFAMAGVKIPYLSILDPNCVEKSYPQFWQDYKQTGMLILPRKTVI